MTQEEFKIFSDKYQVTLTKFQERLKSRPNETYRDEMIAANTDAIVMLIQHIEDLTKLLDNIGASRVINSKENQD